MINDLFSRGILLGLGAAIAGKEKFEETIMKMVDQGMMSKQEADTYFSGLMKKGAEKSENWNREVRMSIKDQLKDLGFVTKDEFDTLQAQIVLLQQEIATLRNNGGSESREASAAPGTFTAETSGMMPGTETDASYMQADSGITESGIITDLGNDAGSSGGTEGESGKKIPPNTDIVPD